MRQVLIAVLFVLAGIAGAADDAVVAPREATSLKPQAPSLEMDAVTIPQMLSYQGKLTDTFGLPVVDTTYSVNFRLYTAPSGGSSFWNETQTVRTRSGLFSTLLGSVTPIGSMPDAGAAYLGMAVDGGSELAPRLRIASAAYAYLAERAANADLLQGRDTTTFSRSTHNHDKAYVNEGQADAVTGTMLVNGTVRTVDVGDTAVTMAKLARAGATTGQVVKWTGSAWAPRNDSVGGGGGTVTSVSQGTGVTCDPNPITTTGTVALNTGYADGRYINVGETASGDITGTYPGPTVDGLQGRHISTASPGVGQVLKYNGAEWVPANDSAGAGDNAWVRGSPDSVLYTINRLGIARGGSNNALYGTQRFTHVNLGIACTTGTSGQNHSYATVAGGWRNVARDSFATVAGGGRNTASGVYATVAGGQYDTASANFATVGGGYSNTASGNTATVGGGYNNDATGSYATVAGGYNNDATGSYATVAGGQNNAADIAYATVGGGYNNDATGSYATVAGGQGNTADTTYATVGGGGSNGADAAYATVAGGYSNDATGSYATVAGGYNNAADTTYATVAGGYYNTASGQYATVGGGYCDTARAYASGALSGRNNVAGDAVADSCAVVCGGRSNSVTGKYGAVGGGEGNSVAGWHGTVAGGYQNSAAGFRASVLGGESNAASGWRSTVGGGSGNSALGDYATVPGGYTDSAAADYSFATNNNSVVPSTYTNSAAFNGQRATAASQTRVGALSKASGTFTIDHPLDPSGKILNHYFIEGPEMRNIYDGEAVLDGSGRAEVRLPDYFDALNRAPRVQLTGVRSSDVYVAQEVAGNRFTIGGKPGTKVFWQVTGERKDVSAEATRRMMPVEQPKTDDLAGTMLDDDFLSGCMDQLVREGKSSGINFRTASGRARYEKMKQSVEQR